MFTRKNILSISCSDLADSINNIFGIKKNDYDNPNYISSSDILNAFSCKQECDSKYFMEISISKNKINDVIEEYHNAIFIDKSSMRNIALRMRAISWLREHVPLDENSVLLEVDY